MQYYVLLYRHTQLNHVNRINVNHEIELEVISNYKDLITTELNVIRLEVEISLNFFPNNLKLISEFINTTQNESWLKPTDTKITDFKNTVNKCQNMLVINIIAF